MSEISLIALHADHIQEISWVRALFYKHDGWQPEQDDEEFEKQSRFCFLSNISHRTPVDIHAVITPRHGMNEHVHLSCGFFDEGHEPFSSDEGLPFHAPCFEIFKRVSLRRFGRVDIDGLWMLYAVKHLSPHVQSSD